MVLQASAAIALAGARVVTAITAFLVVLPVWAFGHDPFSFRAATAPIERLHKQHDRIVILLATVILHRIDREVVVPCRLKDVDAASFHGWSRLVCVATALLG